MRKTINLRDERLARDDMRWAMMDQEAKDEEDRNQRHRIEGTKTKKNQSGMPFNPITFKVRDDPAGRALLERDGKIKDRAVRRMARTYAAGNSSFNPITGCDEPIAGSSLFERAERIA